MRILGLYVCFQEWKNSIRRNVREHLMIRLHYSAKLYSYLHKARLDNKIMNKKDILPAKPILFLHDRGACVNDKELEEHGKRHFTGFLKSA